MKSLLQVLGNIKSSTIRTNSDDGVTQAVEVKSGIHMCAEQSIPNPIWLKPYRTFSEVDQPPSQFVLRLRDSRNGMPECALYEADGGVWKSAAIENIKEYLEEELPEVKIIA
jgi:hypothetical protein